MTNLKVTEAGISQVFAEKGRKAAQDVKKMVCEAKMSSERLGKDMQEGCDNCSNNRNA